MMPNDRRPVLAETEISERITRLQRALRDRGAGGALIVQKTDLFYFSGTSQQGWLWVPEQGSALLMVFKDVERARAESPLKQLVSLVSPKKIPAMLAEFGYELPPKIGLELDVLPTNLFFQYRKIFTPAELVDISTEIRLIRAVKSEFELELLGRAASFSDLLSARVPDLLEVGKTEIAVAGELESYARSLGHQGIVRMRLWGSELFYGHLMSGPAAAVPSYLASPTGGEGPSVLTGQGAGFNKIEKNVPILVDYVFALNGYLSDHARIFCIGALPDELLRAHEAMLEIQDQVKAEARPGIASGEIYDSMLAAAADKGYEEWFMGVGKRRVRFTGHGIGLELDEFPFIAKGQQLALEKNMVIALEPKVIMPGKGVVGIENSHVLTEHGLKALTKSPDSVTCC